jgi:tetratricopeptide (TPR) repeat protein
VWQFLTQKGYDVFLDYKGIASGDFESAILENIRSRAHFLVILTPSALDRCNEPGDWFRREIETALETRRNIVPLMLDGFSFSTPIIAEQLTGSLAPLKSYNALTMPAEYIDAAMSKLDTRFLGVPLSAVLHPASAVAVAEAREQMAAARAAAPVEEEELAEQQRVEIDRLRPGMRVTWKRQRTDAEEVLYQTEQIRLNPRSAEAYRDRALARSHTGDHRGAIEDYDVAVRLDPNNGFTYNNRAVAHIEMGHVEEAIADYTDTIRLWPNLFAKGSEFAPPSHAYYGRAKARSVQGDLDGALADFDMAIAGEPENGEYYVNRGLCRRRRGEAAEALADCNRAVELSPDQMVVYRERAHARRDAGDKAGAMADVNKAISMGPDAESLILRGFLQRELKGDVAAAVADMTAAIALEPGNHTWYMRRSSMYRHMKRYDLAVADLRQYLKMDGARKDGHQVKDVEEYIEELRRMR